MTRGGTVYGKTPKPEPPGLVDRLKALRNKPKTLAGLLVLLVLLGWAWGNRESDGWVTVAPAEMRLAVGASQDIRVAYKFKWPFLWRGSARSAGATIQLISFPSGVEVAPTTTVTTGDAPEAVFKVTGLRESREELIFGGSNRPSDQRTWRTMSAVVVVTR
jgi:hypothetical protein